MSRNSLKTQKIEKSHDFADQGFQGLIFSQAKRKRFACEIFGPISLRSERRVPAA